MPKKMCRRGIGIGIGIGVLVGAVVARSELPSIPVVHEPFVQLEHVNLNWGGSIESLEEFWFSVLRFGRDPRAASVLALTNEARGRVGAELLGALTWANIGLQQVHLPSRDGLEAGGDGRPWQKVRGELVLTWPAALIEGLRSRLEASQTTQLLDGPELRFRGPGGNAFAVESGERRLGPAADLDDGDALPGPPSEGTALRAIRFDVPRNSSRAICDFYRRVFEAAAADDAAGRCSVPVGFGQSIDFLERDRVEPYDRHHIALYVNGPAFARAYDRLAERNLVYFNPRFPQFEYDSWDKVLTFNEFRFKDIQHLDTNEPLYELEHEIRNLRHHGFALKHRLRAARPADANNRTADPLDCPLS
mmetsp:Transcript_6057/g.18257  ORF Transcript_6057/g.18257 Transcript_6057/m.18257 type:complete len:362 (+) Transcript_6057:20-1105(+)